MSEHKNTKKKGKGKNQSKNNTPVMESDQPKQTESDDRPDNQKQQNSKDVQVEIPQQKQSKQQQKQQTVEKQATNQIIEQQPQKVQQQNPKEQITNDEKPSLKQEEPTIPKDQEQEHEQEASELLQKPNQEVTIQQKKEIQQAKQQEQDIELTIEQTQTQNVEEPINSIQTQPISLQNKVQQSISSESIELKQKKSEKHISQSPQPITLISTNSNIGGSNEDLDQQQVKQTKTSKRLAKFKEKKKKSVPKKQDKSPEPQKQSKPSIVPKINPITETVSNLKSKFTRPTESLESPVLQKDLDQEKMLSMMIQSKKKENYKTLKAWDDKRVAGMSLHLNVVSSFQRSLDAIARISFDNIEIYLSTFREIYIQQEKYGSHPMIDTIYTTKNNNISKNIYINCSCILNALNEQNMERAKKAKQFAEFLRVNILNDVLELHIKKSQQSITTIKTRISGLKSVLSSTQNELQHKTQKLAGSFSQNILLLEDNKDKDYYESELQFLRLAEAVVGLHQQYAQLVLEYFEIIRQMQIERAETIKKAIKIYSEVLQTSYQSKTAHQLLQQLGKGQERKLIDEFYSVEEILPPNIQYLVKQNIKVSQEGFLLEHLTEYLKSFNFQNFDLRQLILKQYPIRNSTNNINNSILLITVDKFVHVFSTFQGYAHPTATYKIDKSLHLKRKGNQLELEKLPEKKGGVLGMLGWGTKGMEGIKVVFQNKDKAQQAEDYIRKLV